MQCQKRCQVASPQICSRACHLARRGSKAYWCGSGPEGAAGRLTASHLLHLPQHGAQVQCHPCMQARIVQHLRSSLNQQSASDSIGAL